MKFNKNQRITLYTGLGLIIIALITWLTYGGEIFTKDQVLVQKTDEIFGTTYNIWEDKFILGLDYTAIFIGLISLFTALAIYFQRNKKN